MNKRKIITIVMVFALIFALCSCAHPGTGDIAESSKNQNETENTTNSSEQPSQATEPEKDSVHGSMKEIGEGIYASELISYSGEFVEDGSNEKVKNIASLDLVNEGSADIQYIEISVKTEKEAYEFVATTLIRGIKVTVLEKDRKPFEKNAVIVSAQIKTIAPFQSEISVCRDDFEVQIMDSVMNLRNISDKDYSSTVFVYYKNYVGDGFLGGITYRVRFDTIGAGELRQMSSSNLVKGTSKVVFITTGE